jgi:hypothetical protein
MPWVIVNLKPGTNAAVFFGILAESVALLALSEF